jgi:pyridoxamine 5'-phosphate oxidase
MVKMINNSSALKSAPGKPQDGWGSDPFDLFNEWFHEAASQEATDPNAMALATVGPDGRPAVRMVLLKSLQDNNFLFYTNTQSRKGQEITQNPAVALCFYWKTLNRQVRVEGPASLISPEEADAYFASRPIGAQLGAWASHQSSPLESRDVLEERLSTYALQFGDDPIPRPPYWSGFRIAPTHIEFWQDRPFRLHDRILYTRTHNTWTLTRLYP